LLSQEKYSTQKKERWQRSTPRVIGHKQQQARSLIEAEEELLFETKQFGDHDLEVLQRTLWLK